MPIGFNVGMKTLFALLLISLSLSAVADNPYAVEAAIYKIEAIRNGSQAMGTGVLVARNKILTNCHVVNGGSRFVVTHRKTGDQFEATKSYSLGDLDACILVGEFAGSPARLNADFVPGENVWIFGFPEGIPVVGRGTVKGLVDTNKGKSLALVAFCAPGSSGGPVVNVKGELIGLNWGSFQYRNQCLSIPAAQLRPYLM